jgi:hypothetical protein
MTHPTIIGLWSPAPGCGKSTVAQHLYQRHGHIRLSFADPMKWMLVSMLQDAGYSYPEARRIPWEDKETPLDRLPGAPQRPPQRGRTARGDVRSRDHQRRHADGSGGSGRLGDAKPEPIR